jgi:hypothetical protein
MKKMWGDLCLKRLWESYRKQAKDSKSEVPDYEGMFKDVPGVVYGCVAKDWKFEA